MLKTTLKSVAVALSILAAVIIILTAVDGVKNVSKTLEDTCIKVTVVDLDGSPVHNAIVTIDGQSFYTDNKGSSPSISLKQLTNCYDRSIAEWGTVTVRIDKENYSPAFVFHCVVYRLDTRYLTVKIYPADNSDLPYVSYVESPPDEYIQGLLDTSDLSSPSG